MEAGAKMLVSHIARGSKIMIQIDSDVDGMTSAALLINFLNNYFPAFVQNNISYRPHTEKTHGIILDTVPADVKLVIAPDSSSNQYDVHEALHDRGVDVLILDHHESDKVSEYACVINNQLCDYPTKSLSGVGVVYKFCCYLDSLLNGNCAPRYLDLVACGEIADMMDLRDFETHELIKQGLQSIQNPFIQGMVQKNEYSLKGKITPTGIAFYVAPYINAVMRIGSPQDKLLLFEAMLESKAYEEIPSTKRGCSGQFETRVEQACRHCTNIKNRQAKARDASLEIIEKLIEEQHLLDNKILLVRLNQKLHAEKNITGLIANQLMNKYQRPTLVLNEVQKEDGIYWEGSGRGYDKSELKDFKQFLSNTGLMEYTEGHNNAFGAGLKDSNVEEFIQMTNDCLVEVDFTPKYDVDFIFNAKDESIANDITQIAEYEQLWGQKVDEPYVVLENLVIKNDNIQLLKGSTLKITVSPMLSLIKFGSSEDEYNDLYSPLGCVTINVLGKCEINSWDDKPQIKITDYEIVDRQHYYF